MEGGGGSSRGTLFLSFSLSAHLRCAPIVEEEEGKNILAKRRLSSQLLTTHKSLQQSKQIHRWIFLLLSSSSRSKAAAQAKIFGTGCLSQNIWVFYGLYGGQRFPGKKNHRDNLRKFINNKKPAAVKLFEASTYSEVYTTYFYVHNFWA